MDKKTKDFLLKKYPLQKVLIEKLSNWDQALSSYKSVVFSAFLNEEQQALISDAHLPYQLTYFGGVGNASMQRLVISRDEFVGDSEVVVLVSNYHAKYQKIEHRQLLGSLMQLGIERDCFGDLIVEDERLIVVTTKQYIPLLCFNKVKIGRYELSFKEMHDKVERVENWVEKQYIVSSLRLDVIVSALTNLSREKAASLIRNRYVKLNHQTIEDVSKICNNNNEIIIRSYGRFKYIETLKQTKKERIVILVASLQ